MSILVDGFVKFRNSRYPELAQLFKSLAHTQTPRALFITCSDSRVVPELLTQQEPGGLFVIRNAGNIVPSYGPEPGGVSASVEYAIAVLGIQDVVICGHSDCGALTAIARNLDLQHLPAVAGWLRHADAAIAISTAHQHHSVEEHVIELSRENVIAQIANLRTHPSVALALSRNKLRVHGWVYDIEAGQIDALESTSGRFVQLSEHPDVVALEGRQEIV